MEENSIEVKTVQAQILEAKLKDPLNARKIQKLQQLLDRLTGAQ